MKRFIFKILVLSLIVLSTLVLINYIVDPGNLYRGNIIIEQMVNLILDGNTIIYPGDLDERQFKRTLIETTKKHYDVGVVGSSHIMHMPFEYKDYMNFGMSGSDLSDYYNIVGELDYYDNIPNKIIIGIDTWFADDDHLTGISKNNYYSDYLYKKIHDGIIIQVNNLEEKGNIEKALELFSFPYFQTSIQNINKKGIFYYISSKSRIVEVAKSEEPLDNNHLLKPTCELIMYLSGEKSVDEKDNAVNYYKTHEQMYGHKTTGFDIDNINIDEFYLMINYLQSKGVEVEFYLPSIYPAYWDYILESAKYNDIILLEPKIREYAKERNILVRGTYDPYKAGINKKDFYDELHMYSNKMWENFNLILNE